MAAKTKGKVVVLQPKFRSTRFTRAQLQQAIKKVRDARLRGKNKPVADGSK